MEEIAVSTPSRNRRVHAVDARLDSLQQGHLRHPGGGMTVQVQAHLKTFFDFADQLIRRYPALYPEQIAD